MRGNLYPSTLSWTCLPTGIYKTGENSPNKQGNFIKLVGCVYNWCTCMKTKKAFKQYAYACQKIMTVAASAIGLLTCCRAAASFNSSSASEKLENHWLKGWSLVSPRFFSYGTISTEPRWMVVNSVTLVCPVGIYKGYKLWRNKPGAGGGKVKPGGSLGTLAAGWFWTRWKKASEGSGKIISSYVSTTTGFLVDGGPASSSG